MHPVEIDIHEEFPRLSKAPIAEAALEIRARATGDWEETGISEAVRTRLPEYPHQEGRNIFQGGGSVVSGKQPRHELEDLGWCGVVAKNENKRQVAFLERDRFLFSKLAPYSHWDAFQGEALRLWDIHGELARPMTLQRIAVRFINHFPLPQGELRLEPYLRVPPKPADTHLGLASILHRDALAVPGHDYEVTVTCATQPAKILGDYIFWALIIDVAVLTTTPHPLEDADLNRRLPEMRWLKNRAFFGTIADELKEMLQ